MSLESAKLFHLHVQQNPDLQSALADDVTTAYDDGGAPDWKSIAHKYGFDMTQEEADAYWDGLCDEEYELTEFELEMVAAATPPTCVDTGA